MDIPSFLRMYPPFDELDDERLAEIVRHTHIEFFPAGAAIVHRAAAPSEHLYVVRKGVVEAVDGEAVADVLGEGEFFGFVSMFTGLEAAYTVRAVEDTICYLIDQEIAMEVMATRRGLAFLAGSLRRREVSVLEGPEREALDPWAAPVSTLVRREPQVVPATSTVKEAAEVMTRERISSVLVEDRGELGILTDRDLRAKVVAVGRSAETLGTGSPRLTLEQAADRFDVPVASPHHALDDALVTVELFLVAASKLEADGVRTARDLLRAGASR